MSNIETISLNYYTLAKIEKEIIVEKIKYVISNYSEERTVTLNSVKQFDWKNVVKKLTSFYD